VKLLGRRARAAKLPIDDVAQTHWGRNLYSPRVDADEKAYK